MFENKKIGVVVLVVLVIAIGFVWFFNSGCVPVVYPLIGPEAGNVRIPGDLFVGGDTASVDGNFIADADNDNVGTFIQSPAGNENGNDNFSDNGNGHPLPDDGELEVEVEDPTGHPDKPNDGIYEIGEEITFSGSWTGGTPPFEVKWFFPDGNLEKKTDFDGREFSVTRAFNIPGGGSARLIVEDSAGKEVSESVLITVRQ